ncbi:MAG: hypothetical protein KKB70_11555 [Proteobacteria bacterium]|nr:hypothetical protein [Pseudomonadota bacterium]
MHDFESYRAEMQRQTAATITADPDLARSVLDGVIEEARAHPGHGPLTALTARIGAAVIAEFLNGGRLDDAEAAWKEVLRVLGDHPDVETRAQAGQCASNLIMGQLRGGQARDALATFRTLVSLADPVPALPELDTLLAGAAIRLIVVWLQIRPPMEAYDFYIALRQAAQRAPDDRNILHHRAKACLLLTVGFSRAGDPNFGRTLAAETRTLVDTDPDDPVLDDIRTKLDRLFSSDPQ